MLVDELLREIREKAKKTQAPRAAAPLPVTAGEEGAENVGVSADEIPHESPPEALSEPEAEPRPREVEQPPEERPAKAEPSRERPQEMRPPVMIWQQLHFSSASPSLADPEPEREEFPAVRRSPFPRFELDRAEPARVRTNRVALPSPHGSRPVVADPRCPRGIPGAYAPEGPGWVRVYKKLDRYSPNGTFIPSQCVWEKQR